MKNGITNSVKLGLVTAIIVFAYLNSHLLMDLTFREKKLKTSFRFMKDLGLYEGLAPEFTLKRVAVQSCHNILPFDND